MVEAAHGAGPRAASRTSSASYRRRKRSKNWSSTDTSDTSATSKSRCSALTLRRHERASAQLVVRTQSAAAVSRVRCYRTSSIMPIGSPEPLPRALSASRGRPIPSAATRKARSLRAPTTARSRCWSIATASPRGSPQTQPPRSNRTPARCMASAHRGGQPDRTSSISRSTPSIASRPKSSPAARTISAIRAHQRQTSRCSWSFTTSSSKPSKDVRTAADIR